MGKKKNGRIYSEGEDWKQRQDKVEAHRYCSVVDTMQGNSMSSPLPQSDVISLLHRIEQSNKELNQRVKKMEKQNASVTSSSPVTVPRASANSQNVLPAATSYLGGPAGQQEHPMAVDPTGWRQQAQGVGQDVAVGQQAGSSLRPPPTLEAVRSSSDISRAVTRLLSYYDDQAEMEVL